MTKTYIKLPIEIEAVKFTDENKDQVYSWASALQNNVYHGFDVLGKPILKIPKLGGDMICSIGDYLIKDPFSTDWCKLYPCKPNIFKQAYDIKLPPEIKQKQDFINRSEADFGFMGSPDYDQAVKDVQQFYADNKDFFVNTINLFNHEQDK